ncbi:unnamed protein product [Bursaphelenchus okinawaensis]|uniref:Small nuclear RNA-activating complex polypeptide 3 n=1 Tax=Bursaphelenchus okinawaensis TaxID=465554 RepID=A0A811LA94_9BILA|nr:unnamed protein product [Bursaphelenchus okinawaensis]CAG9119566.1 unnamed protein product [Bursaphelenchus okinawaensis]
MSMDHVQPPSRYCFFSPPINLKKFLDDATQAEDSLYSFFNEAAFDEQDVRETFVNFFDNNRQNVVDAQRGVVEVDANLENIIHEYPMVEFEPTFPPKDSKHRSHLVLNELRKETEQNTRIKNSYLHRGRYFKYRDFDLQRPLKPKNTKKANDFVVTVSMLAPQNVMSSTNTDNSLRKQCEVKYMVTGDMLLSKLREKVFCQADYWCNKQDYEDNSDPNNYFMNLYPSGFFFIYDTFFVDKTNPNATDISKEIREFMKRKKDSFKEHYVEDMTEVKISDLTIRLGQPYVFVHQGHCEHLIIFTDLRLMNVNDIQDLSLYPVILYDSRKTTNCCVCKDNVAAFVVTESDRMPVNPGFMCERCFKRFHYERKMRIGDFKAYHFVDKGCYEPAIDEDNIVHGLMVYEDVENEAQSPKISTMEPTQYEKICKTFCKEEKSFIEDVSTIVNVFKRRLEQGIGGDAAGKKIITSVFGNVGEIYELAIKIHRTIDEGMEMTDPPCIGAGFIELAEGMEFEAFVNFSSIFEDNIHKKVSQLIQDPKYESFFDLEDRTYSTLPTGRTFRMAVKYVLPALLYSVVAHFYSYLKYVKMLQTNSLSDLDKEDLYNCDVMLMQVSKQLPTMDNVEKLGHRFKKDSAYPVGIIPEIQKSIEGWVGKNIGAQCYAFIREGDLQKARHNQKLADNLLRGGKNSSEVHVFLFDNLLVITKSTKTTKNAGYRYKDQYDIRKADIVDVADDEELKNVFRIRAGAKGSEVKEITLFCHTPEDRDDWMTSLIEMQTSGILTRMRDAYQKEEEKRIPLMIPTPSEYRYAEPDMDENIIFEDYTHSGVPVVRSGTILKLIERLTYPHYVDSEFLKTFMTTYRSFCSSIDLMNYLIERFSIPVPQVFAYLDQQFTAPVQHNKSGGPLAGRYDTVQSHGWSSYNQISPDNLEQAFHRFREEFQKPIQHKVMQIMNHWVRYHTYDFIDPDLCQKMKDFLNGNIVKLSNNQKKLSAKILDALEKKLKETDPSLPTEDKVEEKKVEIAFSQDVPEVVWHTAKQGDIDNYDILTLHPLEIGRQVTLLHFYLYKAIKPIELVDAAWTKQDEKYKKSPQLLKLIDHSTKLTYWVAKSIIETKSIEERVELFSRILEIMCVFEELNNFNGVVAFYSALNCSSVFRLKDSQSRLDKEKQAWYGRFQKLCDPHWKEMLQRLRSINPPCVPFAGTYLSQIFFFKTGRSTYHQTENDIHDDDPEVHHRKLVSFVKCRKIAAVIREIQMYQNQPYALKVEPSIRQFFEQINPLEGFDDKDEFEAYLYDRSIEIEPREGGAVDNGKPKHSAEDLKSPGIKPKSANSNFQRSRSHNAYHSHTMPAPFPHKPAPKSTLTSPVQKSPPALSPTDENPFAILDISPGHHPKWVGDAHGRVNQAFTSDYIMAQPPHSAGLCSSTSPNDPRSPASANSTTTPNSSRRLPPAPLSSHETRFAFPPIHPQSASKASHKGIPNVTNATFNLSQPPLRKDPTGSSQTLPLRKPPAPTPSSPPLSVPLMGRMEDSENHPDFSVSLDEHTSSVPPRPAPLEDNGSPSPRSPTVSLMVPLPSSAGGRSEQSDEAMAPPRPPKPSGLSRNPSTAGATSSPNDELKVPPLPPKPRSAPSLETRPAEESLVLDAPPLPPKPKLNKP